MAALRGTKVIRVGSSGIPAYDSLEEITSPTEGMVIKINGTPDKYYIYKDSAWVELAEAEEAEETGLPNKLVIIISYTDGVGESYSTKYFSYSTDNGVSWNLFYTQSDLVVGPDMNPDYQPIAVVIDLPEQIRFKIERSQVVRKYMYLNGVMTTSTAISDTTNKTISNNTVVVTTGEGGRFGGE